MLHITRQTGKQGTKRKTMGRYVENEADYKHRYPDGVQMAWGVRCHAFRTSQVDRVSSLAGFSLQ
jgi:hypothetical protein